MDKGDWLIFLLALAAFLFFFAARVAGLNGHEIFSIRTLKEVAPWLALAALLIGGRELVEWIRRRNMKQ